MLVLADPWRFSSSQLLGGKLSFADGYHSRSNWDNVGWGAITTFQVSQTLQMLSPSAAARLRVICFLTGLGLVGPLDDPRFACLWQVITPENWNSVVQDCVRAVGWSAMGYLLPLFLFGHYVSPIFVHSIY